MEMPLPWGGHETNTVLSDIARVSLSDAVDLLIAVSLDTADTADDSRRSQFVKFGRAATTYAIQNPQPAWVVAGQSNDDFVESLIRWVETCAPMPTVASSLNEPSTVMTETFQSLGFQDTLNWMLEGSDRIKDTAGQWISRKKDVIGHRLSQNVMALTRSSLHPKIARFVGDVIVYINERGNSQHLGAIPATVLADLEAVAAERTEEDPLIVVGHSMGGVILYDLISGFIPSRWPDLIIDALVTVGSQVALFEEMKQFRLRDDSVPGPGRDRMPRPANLRRWINIFDTTDVLSFAANKVFDGVEDYAFSSETDTFSSHSAYFLRPSFYERLRVRLSTP
ncbi:alpha/beta fold hydrolase [Methylobacter marinus]|uniref:alpha/beta hydrolase n=1 Tax=Methylobacter marinus TaxID=34058 RepID=UPI0012EC41C2|nr:alpha/beta hydrolase [Methylobacter marinus]